MENKQLYIQQAADWASARGFEDIRANINGYQTPIAYNRPQDGQLFIPDVTGKQMGRKSYFEVVLPTDD